MAASGLAQEDKAQQFLAGERLGGLKLGMGEKDLIVLLGSPKQKTKPILLEAVGEYYQTWRYPGKGLEITMTSGAKRKGAKTVASFLASAGCTFATTKGIRIGSSPAAVRQAYGPFEDKEDTSAREKDVFVAGSIYGGIIFNFKENKVSRIFFGAAAE